MKLSKQLVYYPIIALTICLFVSAPVGLALTGVTFILSLAYLHNRLPLQFQDVSLFIYFTIATLVYLYLGPDSYIDYAEIVVFPFLMYLTTSTIQSDGVKPLKLLLVAMLIYTIVCFFRDVNGEFTLSIADNNYMHNRGVEDAPFKGTVNRFFKNATLVSIWPLTSSIIALCLFNETKKRLYFFLMLASFFIVFLTNTRSALGCSILILVINLIIYKQAAILRLMMLAAAVLYFVVSSLGNLYQSQIERFNQLTEGNSSYGLGNRQHYWNYTINLIDRNIWGYGHEYVHKHLLYSTHNEVLGQLVSIGVVGAIFYFFFIGYNFVSKFKILRNKKENTIWNEVAFYLLIVYIITGMFEQLSLGNKYWMALVFGILGWSKNKIVKINLVRVQLEEVDRSMKLARSNTQ